MDKRNTPQIEVRNIDHLGIVAGIVDEIGLVEEIDRQLGTDPREHVSCGQALKAMILNGLGFVSAPLYLFEEFFTGKATEHLIAPGVKPEHLNDDRLGRVLDKLFEAELTKVFVGVAMRAAARFGICANSVHLDATSLHVHGEYAEGEGEPAAIRLTHGYSRDHRPDLKQFVVDLMCTGEGGIPLFLRVADGNEADQATFAGLIRRFEAQLNLEALFVADSALYGAEHLSTLSRLCWLCRVPATLTEAKRLLSEVSEEAFAESRAMEGYRLYKTKSNYGGVSQRWLVVENEARRRSERARLERRLRQLDREAEKELMRLRHRTFSCEEDARKAAEAFAAKLKYPRLTELKVISLAKYEKPGRPAKGTEPRRLYRIEGKLHRDGAAIFEACRRAGRYILATNLLDRQEISGDELLTEYKDQHSVERGFRFLKDPLFFTSSVFLKSPRRVAALAMVMGLCLLVYALGERMLRRVLEERGAEIRHQTGKPTDRPTLRWVFQLFQAVHLLSVDGTKQITNLTEERKRILSFLVPGCRRYYLLGSETSGAQNR
jgi:transposase